MSWSRCFTTALATFSVFAPLTAALKDLPRCGKNFKDTHCPVPLCCSDAGYCGLTEEYCSVPGNCQERFGMCDSMKTPHGASTKHISRKFDKSIPEVIRQCSKPRTLALTYDDGPSKYTNEVLDVLAEYGARGTFMLGGILNGRGSIDDDWADVVKRMDAEGHQIGSHTWSHPNLNKLDDDQRKEQMYKNERAIANVINKIPVFMRAPMIKCDHECREDMKDLGYHIVR